ncbi:MAG: hypothetical protein Q9182_004821 [Xanthomendoza sp. 2 TL-2023]
MPSLLDLPLELQWMIYREVVAPFKDDDPLSVVDYFYYCPRKKVFFTREAATFLRTCKHINHQASQVFWDKGVCEITLLALNYYMYRPETSKGITDWQSIGLPPKESLPQLRNLSISLRHGTKEYRFGDPHEHFLSENFAVLCHELATHCRRLKNVVIDIPCHCHYRKGFVNPSTDAESEDPDCMIEPEVLVRLIKPIRRIRVSKSITLRCSCHSMDKIQPVFDDLTAICKSSAAVEPHAGNQKVWFDLKEADKSQVKDLQRFEQELSRAWTYSEYGRLMLRDESLEQSVNREEQFWRSVKLVERLLEGFV